MSKRSAHLHAFNFESYGVRVRFESPRRSLLEHVKKVALRSLVGNLREISDGSVDQSFRFVFDHERGFSFYQNDECISSSPYLRLLLNFFDSILRVTIAEHAPDLVFLHAGVVGWKGKAIVIPGNSYSGKSTLVAELVRQGAEYYSDEFAIIDGEGRVLPFPRPINMRATDGSHKPFTIEIASITDKVGQGPIEIGAVLLTEYSENARWQPRLLQGAKGIMELIPYTLPVRKSTEFSLKVLNFVASRALIIKSKRNDAPAFTHKLLDFIDNRGIWARIV